MKLSIIALSMFFAMLQPVFAEAADPVFALIEYEHWAMVVGSTSDSQAGHE